MKIGYKFFSARPIPARNTIASRRFHFDFIRNAESDSAYNCSPQLSRATGTLPSGFTLLEMLLSVLILSMLAGITLPLYNSFNTRNDLDIATQRVAETFRRAQIYARGMKDDSAWSVRIETSVVTLFRGTDWSGRTVGYDEEVTLANGVTASGLTEVQFAKLTGLPNTTGTVTLDPPTGSDKTVTINAQGMVEY